MSRGPGRLERSIDAAFAAEPENAFSVEDLCQRVYPGLNRIEKKHRVAALRAMRSLSARAGPRWYGVASSDAVGGARIFFDRLNLMSYATGRVKALSNYGSNDLRTPAHWRADEQEVRRLLAPGGKWYGSTLPGSGWARHVEAWQAERDGDADVAQKLWDQSEAELRRLGFGRRGD